MPIQLRSDDRLVRQVGAWLRDRLLRAVLWELQEHEKELQEQDKRIADLEDCMAETIAEFAAEVDQFSNELATTATTLADEIDELRTRIEQGDRAAVAELSPKLDRLRTIGASLQGLASGGQPTIPDVPESPAGPTVNQGF